MRKMLLKANKINKNNTKLLLKILKLTLKKVPKLLLVKKFRLIGQLKKGSLKKCLQKESITGHNEHLDISLKNINDKKYLEIYSDIADPLHDFIFD